MENKSHVWNHQPEDTFVGKRHGMTLVWCITNKNIDNHHTLTITTWWLIPLSKWVITPVISGLTLLIPFITGIITHLPSGMSHQVNYLMIDMVDVPCFTLGINVPLGQMVPTNDQSQIAQYFKVVRNSSPFRSLSKYHILTNKKHTHQQLNKCQNICCFSKKNTHLPTCVPIFLVVFPWFSQVSHDFSMTFPGHWSTLKAVKDVANNLTFGGPRNIGVRGKNRCGVSYGEFLWWISME